MNGSETIQRIGIASGGGGGPGPDTVNRAVAEAATPRGSAHTVRQAPGGGHVRQTGYRPLSWGEFVASDHEISSRRVLEPHERISEVLSGLIMVLT